MKILILANNDVGLYQFRKELIAELLKKNKVYISLPNGERIQPLVEQGCKFIDTPVDRRGINPLTDMKLMKKYLQIMKKVKPDLVITYTIKPNIYGGLVCRWKKLPYAVNITGLGTAFQKKGPLRFLVTSMYRLGLKKAKVIFFENSENRELFIKEHIVKEKKTCLLNGAGVNTQEFTPSVYPGGETVKFLFMGRVMKEKGMDELFKAMRRLVKKGEKVHLDVLGGYEEDYEKVIKAYEAEGWLTYHGYQKDVKPFIAASHCFVLPSWHEGMANTNLEAAASARPVITSRIAGCKEAVIHGKTGFLCNCKDYKSLYKEMKKFIRLTHDEREAMGMAGREHMLQNFEKGLIVRKTISALME